MAPAFASLKTDIVDAVLTKMVDHVHVLHDHAVSSTLATFSNDYATGKDIFMRHALGVAKLINNKTLEDCIFASASYAWNTAAIDPDSSRLFAFAWNKKGELPRGVWDTTDNQASSRFRNIILQASALDAMSSAAALNPTGIILESREE